MDRFIPNRSAMDFGFAQYMLREGKMLQANTDNLSTYETHLREVFNIDPTRRLLVFGGKKRSAPAPTLDVTSRDTFSPCKVEGERHVNQLVDRILDAPDVIDDFYLNLLDWSNTNVLAIAIGMVVYLWDGSSGKISGIVEVDHEKGPVTSIRWASDGRHIAVGLDSSEVHLWDTSSNRQLRTLSDGHRGRVGSMDWNKHVLTTGSMDGRIIKHDVRVKDHIVWNCRGHQKEVCGLKWSASGRLLASGGSDNVVYIWDRSMASSKWLYKFKDHNASVKALDWCPFQENLLASGGGASDNSIKFWNTRTGACLNSVETGSQVCALLWSKHEPEILSSHGFISNNLVLWKYPSMVRMAELEGHSSRVLHMVQSPDGCTVASLSADETLRFWKVLESPRAAKPKENIEPFAYINRSRIR